MTKNEALNLLECSLSELSTILCVSRSAVTQWNDECIPLMREYQIRDIANKRKPLGLASKDKLTKSALVQNI